MTGEREIAIVRGLIGRDGLLVEADQRLADLNARAGGAIGAPLAIPQLATLGRLAGRLETLISRGIFAADGDHDIDLWVRAEPVAEGVRLALTGWQRRPGWAPTVGEATRAADFLPGDAEWRWETDAALCLTFVSVSAGAHDGGALAELLGQPLTRLFTPGADAHGDLPMLAALTQHEAFDKQPATLRRGGAAVALSAVPRPGRSRFTGYIGAARSLAPAPDAAAAPVDAFSIRLDRALRAPLGAIIGNADSIHQQAEGKIGADYAGYAADIATAGRHLLGLVDDLVDLQAIERPDFHVAAEPIDLADLARRAAGLLAVRAADGGIRIDRPASGEELPALGEFRRVLQILVNLIGNAVRYAPRGSEVWIRVERKGDLAAVIVADQGKGIALADQVRIFEKFERVDPREPGGSGLGLYIARRLARAMSGDIIVDSAPGQGARFLLTLPARDD